MSCFEVLDVLFGELKASFLTWTPFMEPWGSVSNEYGSKTLPLISPVRGWATNLFPYKGETSSPKKRADSRPVKNCLLKVLAFSQVKIQAK
jgi:hypothetical protein